jgi:MoxR-like ATPase
VGNISLNPEELSHLLRIGMMGNSRQFNAIARKVVRKLKREGDENADALLAMLASSEPPQSHFRRVSDTPPPVDDAGKLLFLSQVDQAREPVLPSEIRERIEQIVIEHTRKAALLKAGLDPVRTALFVGPPGAGKTMTVHWIAKRLDLPVYTLNLAGVSSSLLGKTGNNVQDAFDFVRSRPCVLLLDEIDALAKGRDQDDIGEAKRIVTVLLQQLDQLVPGSLVFGASNHGELLDRAIWRRFEVVIEFPAATTETARVVAAQALGVPADDPITAIVATLMTGRPLAEVETLLVQARKREILFDIAILDTVIKFEAARMQDGDKDHKLNLAKILIGSGISQRQASQLTGLARDTIRKTGA